MIFPFRASGVGRMMTTPEKDVLPAGALTYIEEIASQIILDWKPKLDMRVIQKGIECEDDSIQLLNEHRGTNYVKNSERITTGFLTGEWDVYCEKIDTVIDIKSAYSKKTFPLFIKQSDYKLYEWQLTAYMHLKNCDFAELAYVLVDTPTELIAHNDDLSWHRVSNIPAEFRITTMKMERCLEREQQLLRRLELAHSHLLHLLEKRGYSGEKFTIDF